MTHFKTPKPSPIKEVSFFFPSNQFPMESETHIEINPRNSVEIIPEEEQTIPFPFFRPLSQRKENTWIISVFVILHLIAFVVTMAVNNCWGNSNGQCALKQLGRFSFQKLYENPFLGPSASGLDAMGALRLRYLSTYHQLWRLFTSPCLHAGIFHLIISLSSVIFVGVHLEQEFGPLRIGVIYTLSAITGSLVAALFLQDRPSVTSSGALFGLLGATLSGLIRNWKVYTKKFATIVTFLVILIINTGLGLMPLVNNFSNIGGFISGSLCGFMVLFKPQVRKFYQIKGGLFDVKQSLKLKQKLDQPISRTVSLVIFSIIVTGIVVALLQDVNVNEYCSWCKYVDCVPSKWWTCNDKTMSCETMVSLDEVALTCSDNGRFKVLPFPNVSQARIEDLCYLICS